MDISIFRIRLFVDFTPQAVSSSRYTPAEICNICIADKNFCKLMAKQYNPLMQEDFEERIHLQDLPKDILLRKYQQPKKRQIQLKCMPCCRKSEKRKETNFWCKYGCVRMCFNSCFKIYETEASFQVSYMIFIYSLNDS